MKFIKLVLLFLTIIELHAFPVNLTESKFYVREGFQQEWRNSNPEKCSECKIVHFTNDKFNSIRIKKLFPEKYEAANDKIDLAERVADNFTIGTTFHLSDLPDRDSIYGILFERIGINWEIYLNGNLLKSEIHLDENGRVALHKATRFPLIHIQKDFFRKGDNHLYIRLTGDIRDDYLAVFLNSPEIDTVENLTLRQLDLFRSIIHISYLILAVFFLILYFLYPKQTFSLFFSLGLFLYGFYRFTDSHLSFSLIGDSSLQQNLFSISYLLLSGAMLFFINYLFDEKAHYLTKLNFLLICLLVIIKLFLPHAYTFPFLVNISANVSLIAFSYLIIYRIGYIGIKYFIGIYINNLKQKIPYSFFQSLKYSWNTKIEFVLALFLCTSYSSFITDYIHYSKYGAHFYSSDFSFLLFYGLMAFFAYQRKMQFIEQHEQELEKLHLEKETEKLKSQLVIKEEREKVFADIHDNLGGKLLDLSLQVKNIQREKSTDLKSSNKIDTTINNILKGLREQLISIEDMNQMQEDFAKGLNHFLIRRYTAANRKIYIEIDPDFKNEYLKKENYANLLSIIGELINNDIKYGINEAKWSITIDPSFIIFQMSSDSKYSEQEIPSGNGHLTIQKRVALLEGNFLEKLENGHYSAELKISR
jgi:signal transduction histidine kinase